MSDRQSWLSDSIKSDSIKKGPLMFHDSVSRSTRLLCVLGLLGLTLAVAACATTRQSRGSGSQSGFLCDNSDLREGE